MHWLNNLGPKEIIVLLGILFVGYLFFRGMNKSSSGPSYDQKGPRPFGGQQNGPQGSSHVNPNNQQYNQQQNNYNHQNNGYNNQQNNGYNQSNGYNQNNGYNNQQNNGYNNQQNNGYR